MQCYKKIKKGKGRKKLMRKEELQREKGNMKESSIINKKIDEKKKQKSSIYKEIKNKV